MRSSKPLILTALLLILMQTMGCSTYRPLAESLPRQPGPPGGDRSPYIRVTTLDGERVSLYSGWQDSISVGGLKPGVRYEPIDIPLSDVRTIEIKKLDKKRIALGLAVTGVVIGVLAHEFATTNFIGPYH